MAKDPAFLFYPADWIGGTMGMTFEQKGAYMELLMLQFNRGHMTTHMIGHTVGQVFGQIQDKFKKDENGLWYNQRLDVEKEKRQAYTQSRRNNILGENQHNKDIGHMDGHMIGHMVNVNKDINKSIIVSNIEERKKIFKTELNSYLNNPYPLSLIKLFSEYWTEKNKSGTKMRFEMQKTWETNLRLSRWSAGNKDYDKSQIQSSKPKILTVEDLEKPL